MATAPLTADQLNAIAKSSGYTGGTFSSVGLPSSTSLNSTSLAPQSTINVKPAQTTNYAPAILGGNTTIAANGATLTPQATTQQNTDPIAALTSYLDSFQSAPSVQGIHNTVYGKGSGFDEAQAGVLSAQANTKKARSEFDAINAQLAGLSAQGQQMNLMQEGRQAPISAIQGQQAQNNREIAIKALPLQAQALAAQAKIAAAQGDEQLAQGIFKQVQDHLDTAFQLQVQDATNQYNAMKEARLQIYQFLDKREQREADAQQHRDDQGFQVYMENLRLQNEKTLAQYRASLDTSGSSGGNTGTPGTGTLALAQIANGVQEVDTILSDKYLSGAVGPNALSRFSPVNLFTGGKSNFIASVEQLRSQLSLDSLINAKANGATFGALSEGELKLLQQSGSKLSSWAVLDKSGNVTGYRVNETDFRKELDKINNFKRLDYILKGGNPADVGVIIQPDGTMWAKNSDGSYTQLQ